MLARAGSLLLRPRPAASVGCLLSCSSGVSSAQSKSHYSQWLPAEQQQHQQWNSACSVQARSASGDAPSDPADRYQQLGEIARFLLHEAKGASATDRVSQILVASAHTVLNEYERHVVIAEIMNLLCHDFSFQALAALEKNPSALFAIRDTCRAELGRFIHEGLRGIAAMPAASRPIAAIMQLYSMLGVPPREATDLVLAMSEDAATAIPDVPADMAFVRDCMRFAAALSYGGGAAALATTSTAATTAAAGDEDEAGERVLRLVTALTLKVAEGLTALPLPTPREADIESKFATALVAFSVREPDALRSLAAYVERCVVAGGGGGGGGGNGGGGGGVTSVVQVSRFLHCLSALRVSAKPLFSAVGRHYHGRACTWDLRAGVHEYAVLCWAYLAQGMQPPARALQELAWQLRGALKRDEPLPKRCLVELLHLGAYLPDEVAAELRARLERDVVGKYHEARKLGQLLGEANKRLLVNQVTAHGLVTAAGLLDSRTRQWRQWPAGFRADALTREDGYRRGAQPVALVALSRAHTLRRPRGAVGGLAERQRVLLTRAGWTVVLMPLAEVLARRRAGTDYASWVEGCMEDAARRKIDERADAADAAAAAAKSGGGGGGGGAEESGGSGDGKAHD